MEQNLEMPITIILAFLIGLGVGMVITTPDEAILDRYEKMLDTTIENKVGE